MANRSPVLADFKASKGWLQLFLKIKKNESQEKDNCMSKNASGCYSKAR